MPAPKNNKNAQKHGIYSRFIAVADDEEMIKMVTDKNVDEIAYARVRLAAAQQKLDAATDDKDKLGWDYACRHWTEIILTGIHANVQKGQTEVQIFESLFEAVRAANDKQKVVR